MLLLIFFITLTACLRQDAKTPVKSSQRFCNITTAQFRQLDSLYPYIDYDGDSLNQVIADTIIHYRNEIMDMPDTCINDGPVIVKSTDNKFCTVSWDSRQGGTNKDFRALLLFRTSSGIGYRYPADTADYAFTQICYRDIFPIQSYNRTIYMARGYGRGSTSLPWEQVTAWGIRNDQIVPEYIFPEVIDLENSEDTGNLLPALSVEFDIHNNTGPAERPVILFSAQNKLLKVPLPNNIWGWSERFTWLRFDGLQFNITNSP